MDSFEIRHGSCLALILLGRRWWLQELQLHTNLSIFRIREGAGMSGEEARGEGVMGMSCLVLQAPSICHPCNLSSEVGNALFHQGKN